MDKIEILWKIFIRYDREKKGQMVSSLGSKLHALPFFFNTLYFTKTMQDFFQQVINYRPSVLTDSMLGLIGRIPILV